MCYGEVRRGMLRYGRHGLTGQGWAGSGGVRWGVVRFGMVLKIGGENNGLFME